MDHGTPAMLISLWKHRVTSVGTWQNKGKIVFTLVLFYLVEYSYKRTIAIVVGTI